MKNIIYKKYNKKQMLKIIQNEAFLFVETNLKDNYIVRLKDIADFIILESERTGHTADITCYMPKIEKPVLTTCGCYLNKINSILREEIIERLVLLQTNKKKPKKVKIFDYDMFSYLEDSEIGLEDGEFKYYEKFYAKYNTEPSF